MTSYDSTPQPAPQEGEALRLIDLIDAEISYNRNRVVGGRWSVELDEARKIAIALAANPSACELGAVRAETALRDALGYVGQRQDGDLAVLADRVELWMRESRVLIDGQREVIERQKAALRLSAGEDSA